MSSERDARRLLLLATPGLAALAVSGAAGFLHAQSTSVRLVEAMLRNGLFAGGYLGVLAAGLLVASGPGRAWPRMFWACGLLTTAAAILAPPAGPAAWLAWETSRAGAAATAAIFFLLAAAAARPAS